MPVNAAWQLLGFDVQLFYTYNKNTDTCECGGFMKKICAWKRRNSVVSYVAIYLVTLILSIAIIGGYLYQFFYRTVYAEFLSGNKQHLSAIADRHENDLQILNDIAVQMSMSGDMTKFKLREQPKKSVRLQDSLWRYTMVNQFFDQMIYYYHQDDYLYNHSTSVHMDEFLNSGFVLSELSGEEFKNLLLEKNAKLRILPEQLIEKGWFSSYMESENNTLFLLAIPEKLEETLVFSVPSTYYNKLMSGAEKEKRIDFLYYDDQIILLRGNLSQEMVEEDLQELLLKDDRKLLEMTRQQEKVAIGDGKYLLSLQKGSSGIYYGTAQSMEVFHEKVMAEQEIILLLIFMCTILSTIMILYVSKAIMRSVKKLSVLVNEESGYDFADIENGIRMLTITSKENEKENLAFKKMQFIRNFVRGDYQDKAIAELEADKVNLQINYEQYMIVLVRNREIGDENKAYSSMIRIIESAAKVDGYGVHLISNNQNLLVLFGNNSEDMEEVLAQILEVLKSYCTEYVFAVSDCHTNFAESPQAFLEADKAFDNHLLVDSSKIIYFKDVSSAEHVRLVPESYVQQLKTAIIRADLGAVEVAVTDICNMFNGENVSLYAFRMFYNDIISVLLSEWNGDRIRLDNFYNVFTLSQCMNVNDFHDILCEVCRAIIDNNASWMTEKNDLVKRAISYMQQNYSDPELTMNSLAQYLEISSVTLSIEFKNEMDMKPSDYLINIRMEKAKELLRNTDMMTKEISTAVGYEDERVFMRRFKKHTGLTTGQYRRT